MKTPFSPISLSLSVDFDLQNRGQLRTCTKHAHDHRVSITVITVFRKIQYFPQTRQLRSVRLTRSQISNHQRLECIEGQHRIQQQQNYPSQREPQGLSQAQHICKALLSSPRYRLLPVFFRVNIATVLRFVLDTLHDRYYFRI